MKHPLEEKKVGFEDCIYLCAGEEDFVKQYDRLMGSHFGKLLKTSPLEKMIDEASGFKTEECYKFFTFCYQYVWLPLFNKDNWPNNSD